MEPLGLGWPQVDALGSILGGVGTAIATALAIAVLVREIKMHRSRGTDAPPGEPDVARVDERPQPSASRDRPSKKPKPSPEQALRVHARVLNVRKYDAGPYLDGIEFGVTNDSDAPIFDIIARMPGGNMRLRAPSIVPGDTRSTGMREIDVLEHVDVFGNTKPEDAAVGVSFVDKNGVRWSRLGYGKPKVQVGSVSEDDLFPGNPVRWGRRPPTAEQ